MRTQIFSKAFEIAYWKENIGLTMTKEEYYTYLIFKPLPHTPPTNASLGRNSKKKYSGMYDAYDEWGGAEMYY